MTRNSAAILISLMLFTWGLPADGASSAYESEEPVDFALPQLHGEEVSLSEFRGKWVVLNYWATWCVPCRKEIPELALLHDARDDITVLGLAYEETEIENFDEFIDRYQPTYPLLLVDVYAPPEPFGAPKVLPTTIILNPSGYPVKTFMGPVTSDDIESFIDSN
jgi:thiol-disulfide isomerase/thioredoxin